MGLGRVMPRNYGGDILHDGAGAEIESRRANAVSSLHGQVSRTMWRDSVPGARRSADADRPHHQRCARPYLAGARNAQVYDRHLGPDWPQHASKPGFWEAIERRERRRVVGNASGVEGPAGRECAAACRASRRATRRITSNTSRRCGARSVLTRSTIGFARRFATYKRATLMLQDIDAWPALVGDPRMPVQFVFAGKSHPHDVPGKTMLQQIVRLMHDPRFAGKILFLEDYDISVGRDLVQGVDVWANNPRRPLEACGTSGQKVVLNGAAEHVGARRLVGGSLRRPERVRDRHGRNAFERRHSRSQRWSGAAPRRCATR